MKKKDIFTELALHLPFSILSAVIALGLMALLFAVIGEEPPVESETGENVYTRLFHVFHPIHLFLSAIATTAMFLRFDKKILKAVIVGLAGALGICSISDIVMPFLGGEILKLDMHLHFCLFEHVSIVLPFMVLGILVGIASTRVFPNRGSTITSHSAHVLVSTLASLLYLISYGFTGWMSSLFETFVVVVLAVMIPCCLSDIFFPLFMAADGRKLHQQEGDTHCHH